MLGSHLVAWRSHLNISQQQLAQKAQLPRPYLSKLERNMADPSLSVLRRLATALDISVGMLVDTKPDTKAFNRFELDQLARLLYIRDQKRPLGERVWRHLKAKLGESQWKTVTDRFQKERSRYLNLKDEA